MKIISEIIFEKVINILGNSYFFQCDRVILGYLGMPENLLFHVER